MNIRIDVAGRRTWPSDWVWAPKIESRTSYDLWMVRTGRGTLETPEGTFQVQTGDVFVLRPYSEYVGRPDPKDPTSMLYILFNWYDDDGNIVHPDPLPPLYRRVDDARFFATLMVRCLRRVLNVPDAEQATIWLSAALDELERHDRSESRGDATDLERMIRDLAERIVQDPSSFPDVASCAAHCQVSERHFSRIFHRCFECAPQDWIINQRLATAQLWLRNSKSPVKAIAADLGYADVAFFTRQFKQRTGVTPAVYRRSNW